MNWLKRFFGPSPEVKAFVSDLNTVAYSSYSNQRLWLRTGNVLLASYIWALLTNNVHRIEQALPFLAVWLGYVTGKSTITAVRDAVKRNTDIDYQKAKNEGPAKVEVANVERVTVDAKPGAATAKVVSVAEPIEEHEWAEGDPRAGTV